MIKANHKGTNEIDDKDKKKGKNGTKPEEEQKQEEQQPQTQEKEPEEVHQDANDTEEGFKLASPEICKYFLLFWMQ